MPANTALAAMGVTLGACGAKRATTSSPTRLIAHMPRGGFLRSEPSSHFPACVVKRVHTEAPVSIAGIDPQLPIFLRRSAALIGDVVDAREERGGSAAAVTEGYAMRAVLGGVHHVENRAALRPGKV